VAWFGQARRREAHMGWVDEATMSDVKQACNALLRKIREPGDTMLLRSCL
jgi:hypothetical protein